MDRWKRFQLKPPRPICPHSSRAKSSFGKPFICIPCVTDKIEDLLEVDQENNPLPTHSGHGHHHPQAISEIIHNIRLITSALDPGQPDSQQSSFSDGDTMRRVVKIVADLLKVQNDEVAQMIVSLVEKIGGKLSREVGEQLLDIVVTSQKGDMLPFGVVEVLRLLLQRDEWLHYFVDKLRAGRTLPQLFQMLKRLTDNSTRVLRELTFGGSQLSQYTPSQSYFENTPKGQGGCGRDEIQRLVVSIYAIMERTLQFGVEAGGHLYVEEEGPLRNDLVRIYLPNIGDIVANCVCYLKESLPIPVVQGILAFLTTLCSNETTFAQVLMTSGIDLCTGLKRVLVSNCNAKQKGAVLLLTKMCHTYTARSDDYPSSKIVEDFPEVISKIDMIHTISQIMATSDTHLFSCLLTLLNSIYTIPSLREQLGTVMESGLRVVSIAVRSDYPSVANARKFFWNVLQDLATIPTSMQQQIVSVYGKLPESLNPKELLDWAKLLLFCKNLLVFYALNSYYLKALRSLQENPKLVSNLKLFLTLAQAICNANTANEISESTVLGALMQCNCIPAIMVMTKCAQVEESGYLQTLLNLMLAYPTQALIPPSCCSPVSDKKRFPVEYQYESEPCEMVKAHDLTFSEAETYINNGWSAASVMRILAWIRSNMELMKDRQLFDLWNQNVGRIVADRFPVYLPTLLGPWSFLSRGQRIDRVNLLSQIFARLDLNMASWSNNIALGVNSNDSRVKLETEAVLIFYFFTCLFNMKDPDNVVTPDFQQSGTNLLKKVVTTVENTESPAWSSIITYYKIALLIFSCKSFPDCEAFDEQLQILTYNALRLSKMQELEQIVTFCEPVFTKIISLDLFPSDFCVHLVEKWGEDGPLEFQGYFTHTPITSVPLRNQIIEIAAEASTPCSNFMVEIVRTRVEGWETEGEKRTLLNAIIRVAKEVLRDKTKGKTRLQNFCNILTLALHDGSIFDPSLLDTVPVEVFGNCVKVLMSHHGFRTLGKISLTFLVRCLKSLRARAVLNICLEKEFLEFLNKIMDYKCVEDLTEDTYKETYCAFEAVNLVLQAMDDCREKVDKNCVKLKFSLNSVITTLQYYELNDALLKLMTFLLKKDFKSGLIEVVESGDPVLVAKLLVTMQFYGHSVIIRAFFVKSQQIVWNFFHEILNFSLRPAGSHLLKYDLAFDPWFLLTFSGYAPPTQPLLLLPIEFWQFIQRWLKLIGREKSHCRLPQVDYQPFNIASFIASLRQRIKNEILCADGRSEFQKYQVDLNGVLFSEEELVPLKEKEVVLLKIGVLCEKIQDESIDWDADGLESPPPEEEAAVEEDEGADTSIEIIEVPCVLISDTDSDKTVSECELNLVD